MEPSAIEVRPQHRIPMGKVVTLCLKGIAHRLLRSALTFMVIVLAVAFFMSLMVESACARSVGAGVDAEEAVAQLSQSQTADWFDTVSSEEVASRLVSARAPARVAEIAAVAKMTTDQVRDLATRARQEAAMAAFFAGLDAGTRAALVGNRRGEAILDYLRDPQAWAAFADNLKHLFVLHQPMPTEAMLAVVAGHQALRQDLEGCAKAWQGAVDRLIDDCAKSGLGKDRQSCLDALANADPRQLDAFAVMLERNGFDHDRAMVGLVHDQRAEDADSHQVREALTADGARTAWRQTFFEEPPLDAKMLQLGRPEVVTILGGHWSHQELAAISGRLAEALRRQDILRTVASRLGPADVGGNGQPLLSERQAFLMSISFVVCMVGITNAMLMAITERFREIATMKCLGATDGFILNQFLVEAAIQGCAGGLAGLVIGGVLAVLKCLLLYGGYLPSYFPWAGLGTSALLCVAAGIALSTMASIYPSWMASRMAPMEAMRIE
jgi:hypothetical protein